MNKIDVLKEDKISKNKYEDLFKTLYEPLCHYAYSILRDIHESEDTVQKVFYTLWDERATIDIKSSIKSYLYRAVHNTSLNRLKHLKIQTQHQNEVTYTEEGVHNSVFEEIIGLELGEQIRLAIASLPPKCKEIFILSRYKMLSYKEIAVKLNISTNTVENQISKALKILRLFLKDFIPFILLYYLLKVSELC